ncbi:hypothetical protein GGI43DRAFT_418414 [Trichoderma evansii]
MERGRPHGRPRGQKRKRSQPQQRLKICWQYLPLELREMILEALEDTLQGGKAASYAAVCRDFYSFFEPYIFKRLQLSVKRIQELGDVIAPRHRSLVQFIRFRFERSIKPGSMPIIFRTDLDDAAFSYAIFHLFHLLSDWEERDESQPGIVLELSAFSVVDPDGSMKDTIPEELRGIDVTVDNDALDAMYDKSAPRSIYYSKETVKHRHTKLKPFYVSPDFHNMPAVPFPNVQLITDLTVRRQMHSSFFAKYMGPLVKALPKLEFITYEPCVINILDEHFIRRPDIHISVVENIIKAMPSSIRRLQMFEDDDSLYGSCGQTSRWGDRRPLGRLVADLSQDQEPQAISMSFIIDAADFFSDFWTAQITRSPDKLGWINLVSLVLTSSLINPSFNQFPPLLLAAARAARHMPNLEIMEIYNAGSQYGGIFTYIHDKDGSLIHWESTWNWEFPPEVIRVWQRASKVHGKGVFDYSSNRIERRDLKWGGRILSLLRTRATVVHPYTYGNMMNGLNYM